MDTTVARIKAASFLIVSLFSVGVNVSGSGNQWVAEIFSSEFGDGYVDIYFRSALNIEYRLEYSPTVDASDDVWKDANRFVIGTGGEDSVRVDWDGDDVFFRLDAGATWDEFTWGGALWR